MVIRWDFVADYELLGIMGIIDALLPKFPPYIVLQYICPPYIVIQYICPPYSVSPNVCPPYIVL